MILELKKGINSSVNVVGGKGFSLLKLVNAGYSVPYGFIIPSDCFIDTLKANDKYRKVVGLCNGMTFDNFTDTSAVLQDIVVNCDIRLDIDHAVNKLEGLVSVRSSSISEDGVNHSFAGLHDSFLNVKKTDIIENIKNVWKSLFNERALFYRLFKQIPVFEGMAVIIQEMVKAKYAGVTFTVHPIEQNYILVELTKGTAETLVDGTVTPDRFLFDRKTLTLSSSEIKNQSLIDESILKTLIDKCMEIERLFGHPQDIEWAVSDRLYFLQSRAVVL